jgi:hypothetical protein
MAGSMRTWLGLCVRQLALTVLCVRGWVYAYYVYVATYLTRCSVGSAALLISHDAVFGQQPIDTAQSIGYAYVCMCLCVCVFVSVSLCLLGRARALVHMRTHLCVFVGAHEEQDAVVKYGDSIVPQRNKSSSTPAAEEKKPVVVSGMFVNGRQTSGD